MPIPKSVSHDDLMAAIEPLCRLLGTSPKNYYALPGLTVGDEEITFTVPARHKDDPHGRAASERSRDADLPPHPQGLNAEPEWISGGAKSDMAPAAELCYPIVVKIERGEGWS